MALSLAIMMFVTIGGMIGGSLVYDRGYKVRARVTTPQAPAPDDARRVG